MKEQWNNAVLHKQNSVVYCLGREFSRQQFQRRLGIAAKAVRFHELDSCKCLGRNFSPSLQQRNGTVTKAFCLHELGSCRVQLQFVTAANDMFFQADLSLQNLTIGGGYAKTTTKNMLLEAITFVPSLKVLFAAIFLRLSFFTRKSFQRRIRSLKWDTYPPLNL